MKQEVVDLILKDLPNQTAGVLREYIDRAAQLEKDNESLNNKLTVRDDTIKALRESNEILTLKVQQLQGEAQAVAIQNDENQKTILDIEKRERDMKLTVARMSQKAAEERADDIKELTSLLVRNTTFKKKTLSETPVERQHMTNQYNNQTGQYEDVPNGGTYVDNVQTEVTEETTEE